MKKLLFISLTCFIFSCHNGSKSYTSASSTKDTSICLGIYKDGFTGEIKYGEMRRIVKDILGWENPDSTGERKIVKDTIYEIIHIRPVADSAMSKQYGVPQFDSTGKRNSIPLWFSYNKNLIRGGWDNLDTAINQLKRLR